MPVFFKKINIFDHIRSGMIAFALLCRDRLYFLLLKSPLTTSLEKLLFWDDCHQILQLA